MCFILCSLAFVISLVAQVNSQLPPKPIGEWSPDRHHMYPNPWVNASQCQTTEISGLCDYNKILTEEQKQNFIEQPEINKAISAHKGDLCKTVNGEIRFMVTVAIMKQIGPQISDYRAAAKEFAEKFRSAWNLTSCSVILVASNVDRTSFLDAGPDLVALLTSNITDQIDQDIYEEYFMKGRLAEGINATLDQYRAVLEKVASQTTVPPSTSPTTAPTMEQTDEPGESFGSAPIIVGVLIGVIALSIIIIIAVIIFIRSKKRARKEDMREEGEGLSKPPVDV